MANNRAGENGEAFVESAAVIAREAGAILLRHQGRVQIEYKGEADLVTAADRESETHIIERLRHLYPDHAVVAEEGARRKGGSGYCWYVDPLDGTTNFAHRLPLFAVSMGLQLEGRTIAGVVYSPAMNELYSASLGGGARLNGAPIAVSQQDDLNQSLLATGFPSQKRHESPNIHFYQYFSLRTHGMRRLGAAALDLCYTACGRFEAFWEFNLKPWDVAAGQLIVTEAGGKVTDMAGDPFRLDSPEILASNGRLHGAMLAAFGELFGGRTETLPAPEAYFGGRLPI